MKPNQFLIRRFMPGLILVLSVPAFSSTSDPFEEINESWDRFGAVYSRILDNYYNELSQREMMRAAIDGMLEELDSYSQFYDQDGLRQLRQDTSGRFAGLGITVGIKDRYPVVISPIDDTPASRAGLRPGDLIVAIEELETLGLPLKKVVEILRGEPGSTVSIAVARNRGGPRRSVDLEREIIRIQSVALAAEIHPGVGYIGMRQTRFSEDTAEEVREALRYMKSLEVEGVILDLRGNPGGLLTQATEVADLFLPKGAPIVSIREKEGRHEETKRSRHRPVVAGLALVVLIDAGSASASEIVAGAIQDNDRGLIVGTTSFGKGSVQTIFDLHEAENGALKLTTALYYTPSGRSIHRETLTNAGGMPETASFGGAELPMGLLFDIIVRAPSKTWAETALRTRFSLEEVEIERVLATSMSDLIGRGVLPDEADDSEATEIPREYHTLGQRRVFGGGGITPDINVEPTQTPRLVKELARNRAFFNFAVDYVSENAARDQFSSVPEVNRQLLGAFEAFARKDSSVASICRRTGRRELENLRSLVEEMGWGHQVRTLVDSLETQIEAGLATGISDHLEPFVKTELGRELALAVLGQRASLQVALKADVQVKEAVDLLRDQSRYERALHANPSQASR